MEFIYITISSFPFWAIPLGILFLEIARQQKMKGKKQKTMLFVFLSLLLFLASGLFFYFGGHKDIDPVFRVLREKKINN